MKTQEKRLIEWLRIYTKSTECKICRGQINIEVAGKKYEYQLSAEYLHMYNNATVIVRYETLDCIYLFDIKTDKVICALKQKEKAHGTSNDTSVNQITELLALKLKARRMYVNEGQTGKYIAQTLGVRPNTISKWVRVNDWKEAKVGHLRAGKSGIVTAESTQVLKAFKTHLKKVNRPLHDKVAIEITNFLNQLK